MGKKQKTEWQVVRGDGDVNTFGNATEARKEFLADPKAIELRKVIWKIDSEDTWETAGEAEREDITIAERDDLSDIPPKIRTFLEGNLPYSDVEKEKG